MLQKNTIAFLQNIKVNNNKQWFDANRLKYENAKDDFSNLVTNIIIEIAKFDAALGSLAAKDCMFRINRDVRFSKDKSPYKNNFGASFSNGGKKSNYAGYYLHIQPGQSFIGGGFWMPPAETVSKIRQEIDYNFTEWNKIIGNKIFKTNFQKGINMEDALVRPPKGYDENNPAIQYLKLKSFIVTKPLLDTEILLPSLLKDVAVTFKRMQPFLQFLNKALV